MLRHTSDARRVDHAEMRIGDGFFYMGDPGDDYRNPRALAAGTAGVYVELEVDADVDALCERARAAGAEIIEAPADREYGHRRFTARDPEGHEWLVSKPLREVAPEEWGATPAEQGEARPSDDSSRARGGATP